MILHDHNEDRATVVKGILEEEEGSPRLYPGEEFDCLDPEGNPFWEKFVKVKYEIIYGE